LNSCNYSIRYLDIEKPTIIISNKKKDGLYNNLCELIGTNDYITSFQDKNEEKILLKYFLFDKDITSFFYEKLNNY
ncbi:hypothetical protein, partial [Pseudomonas aeruginosa]|uniref:hypothetical protein n=1 Tax=Pseudomonas aeruginosa TaxID=287 RepID=UPI003459A2F4